MNSYAACLIGLCLTLVSCAAENGVKPEALQPTDSGADPTIQGGFQSIWSFYAHCPKMHGLNEKGWNSPPTDSRDQAKSDVREHDDQWAGHHAKVKQERRDR